jgi:hypothetical protein
MKNSTQSRKPITAIVRDYLGRKGATETLAQRVLLGNYASRANSKKQWQFNPGFDLIKSDTGLGHTTICEANAYFKGLGILDWQKGSGNRFGVRQSNLYQLNPSRLEELSRTSSRTSTEAEVLEVVALPLDGVELPPDVPSTSTSRSRTSTENGTSPEESAKCVHKKKHIEEQANQRASIEEEPPSVFSDCSVCFVKDQNQNPEYSVQKEPQSTSEQAVNSKEFFTFAQAKLQKHPDLGRFLIEECFDPKKKFCGYGTDAFDCDDYDEYGILKLVLTAEAEKLYTTTKGDGFSTDLPSAKVKECAQLILGRAAELHNKAQNGDFRRCLTESDDGLDDCWKMKAEFDLFIRHLLRYMRGCTADQLTKIFIGKLEAAPKGSITTLLRLREIGIGIMNEFRKEG